MRSQIRFVMHPEDEAGFVKQILLDPAVLLIDGPIWKSPVPETFRDIKKIGTYCLIWSPQDRNTLDAEFISTSHDWYCRSEFATIQFLRSRVHKDSELIEGRIAVSTTDISHQYFHAESAEKIAQRFVSLRKFIRKTYSNSVVRWVNPKAPRSKATPTRSANPGKPDASLWVGPVALAWLKEKKSRRIKNLPNNYTEAELVDGTG